MLTEPQIYGFIEDYDEWVFDQGELRGVYEFENFLEALAFVNDSAEIIEQRGYAPAILIEDYKVTLTFWKRGEMKIGEQDLEMIKDFTDLLDGTY